MTGERFDGLPITEAEFERWYQASRAASGVPPTIEDPAVLNQLVTLAFAGEYDDAGPSASLRRPMNCKPHRRGRAGGGS